MKMYSNEAVTTTAVNEIDARQTRQIKRLKGYCAGLAVSQAALLALILAMHLPG